MTPVSNISMAWNVATQPQWDDFMCQADRSPLEQSWAYGNAMARCYGQTIDRVVIQHGKQVLAVMQVFHKRLLGFASIVRIVRGPLFLDDTPEALRFDVYRAVRRIFSFRCWKVPLWLPNALDEPEVHFMMRRLGARRMVTGLSSAWLDLTTDLEDLRKQMSGSWRNALKSAEKSGMSVVLEDNSQCLADLMEDYDAFRKGKRFIGPPGKFVSAMDGETESTPPVMALSGYAEGKRIAGIVLVRHGSSATYFVSWTSEAGRQRNAHNLLLWQGIQSLKEAGIRALDLGGLNTGAAAGIARFKLGLRPEPFTLAGTYL